MNESSIRKAVYGVAGVDPGGLYGTRVCPGAGVREKTSRGRSYGTIGARYSGHDHRMAAARLIALLGKTSNSESAMFQRQARRLRLGKKI